MRTASKDPEEQARHSFGRLLRSKRKAARLTPQALARKTQVSLALLRQIERGIRSPSGAMLQRLGQVEELGLTSADLASARAAVAASDRSARLLNTRLTTHSLLAQEAERLPSMQRAARHHLRSVWAYLSPASAQAFSRFRARSAQAHAMAEALPALAARIRPHLGQTPLDFLALGAGDGTHDVRLVEHLLDAFAEPASLALVDLSAPLLARAYALAVERLPSVEVWALLADLEELSLHADVLFLPERQRLVGLLGGTLGELENELRLLRYGLARCVAGDLLVLDVLRAAGHAEAPQGPAPYRLLDEAREWLGTALAPHLPDLPLEWSLRVENRGVVPGSHAWCVGSRLPASPRSREIELYRFTRYDPQRLAACLGTLGWDLVATCPYGDAVGELHLYRRSAPPAEPRRGPR